ncbi:LacI family DNA-binding transcriptional regulator [Streptomyces sp. TRM64462]|uniref:LacI family DNA-binding transcriptional regulator n=1 Tax=Streptomyces sp. TRM64462 TaxID=2741726 RepID=UPI001585D670|nr:LacI family DNA-binding transcriptional regulator [Streptomyces sp. TRM64462]
MTRTVSAAGPTLAVVAREAGVSVPTASKVVNGREDVAPETRRRVTEVLDRLGYVRRPRAGAAPPPGRVDLVVRALGSSRTGAVLRGVEEAAYAAGLDVVVSADRHPQRGCLDRPAARGSAGVLFDVGELTASQHAWLARRGVPYVLIDPSGNPPPGTVSVGAADRRGTVAAIGHLVALGHERIALLMPGRPVPRGAGCLPVGYRAALAAAGLPERPEYVRVCGSDGQGGRTAGPGKARRLTLELLDLPEPPTAVLVGSDALALGVYEALAERGVRAPGGLSVVGFGDLPEARWAVPELTTVRRPLREMAATALRLLVRMAAGEEPVTDRTELPAPLIVRASTAPPPRDRRAAACG